MIALLRTLALALAVICQSQAATFSDEEKTLTDGVAATVRGIINTVSLPVADDLELGPVQSGYFLFTPNAITINAKDDDGKPTKISNQQMFHLQGL